MKKKIYSGIVVALMLILMGVVMGLASPGMEDTDLDVVGNGLHLPVVISELAVYLLLFVRLCLQPTRMKRAAMALWPVVPVILFCLASTTWSDAPSLTLRRSVLLALSTLAAMVVGADFELPHIGRLFNTATVIHIALCGIFLIVGRHYLYSPSDPTALKGLTTHKNIFGLEMGLAVLSFTYCPFQRLSVLRWPLVLLSFVLLVLSHSSGSLGATLGALAMFPFLFTNRFRGIQRIPLLLVSASAAAGMSFLLYQNASLIPGLFSKNPTLTGRTQLWDIVVVAIERRPLPGYGFGSFWQGLQGDSLAVIQQVGWLVPTSHNGYLELLLAVGWIGAALFLPLVLVAISRSLRYLSVEQTSARYFPATFLVFWIIYNFNESALLAQSGITYMLFIMICTSLGVKLRQRSVVRRSAWVGPESDPMFAAALGGME